MNTTNGQSDRDREIELLKKHCAQLGEHFESVQIFVTKTTDVEDGGTVRVNYGSGNWFARLGQVYHWLENNKRDEKNEFA